MHRNDEITHWFISFSCAQNRYMLCIVLKLGSAIDSAGVLDHPYPYLLIFVNNENYTPKP